MDLENCPICWRAFGAAVVPICLVCGHSCCSDCLASIRSCPLCRQKIASSFPRKPNYSLMAMIDRAAVDTRTTQAHQMTQTDLLLPQIQPLASSSRARQQPVSFLEGKAMTLGFKKNGFEIKIK